MPKDRRKRHFILPALVLILLATALPARAAEPDSSAFAPADVDVEQSIAQTNGHGSPVDPSQLKALLSSAGPNGNWGVKGAPKGNAPSSISTFRLGLKSPREIGSATIELESSEGATVAVGVLKPGSAYPGDPKKAADWEPAQVTENHGRFECLFPPGCAPKAILCTVTKSGAPPVLQRLHFEARRLFNLTPFAIAQGEQAPLGSPPASVITGGTWQNAGANREKRIDRHPITDVEPSWLILNWATPVAPALVRIQGTFGAFKLFTFSGEKDQNPALSDNWKLIPFTLLDKRPAPDGQESSLLSLKGQPVRALKLEINEARPKGAQIANVSEFSVWTDLKDQVAPAPPARENHSPVAIEYEVPQDCEMAMVVDDDKGRRVRNLFAQEERKAGKHIAYWDLTDEDGLPVSGGTYRWRAIYGAPLKLKYEFTVYPNIEEHSPLSLPWPAGPRDGFLANHADNTAICAVGDKVYMAAAGTEGGHALLETDLNGAKIWGDGNGAHALFTDGKTLFIRSGDAIIKFDAQQHERKSIFNIVQTPERKGDLAGLAAYAGKIYAAFHGPPPYFENAAHAGLVDVDHCIPKLRAKVPRTDNHNIPITPQRDFMSLFRLGGYIGGDDRCMVSLETEGGTARRQFILLSFNRPVSPGSLIFPMPEAGDRKFTLSLLKPDAPYPPRVKQDSDWIDLDTSSIGPWNCVTAPVNASTRAIRLAFAATGDALADKLEDAKGAGDNEEGLGERGGDGGGLLGAAEKWKGRIDGMRILQRRYEPIRNISVRTSSGTFDPKTGEWDAQRTEVLSPGNPAIYAMEWQTPTTVRGLAIKEIDGAETEVDVYTGPDGKIDIASDAGWKKVATYKQELRNFYEPDATNNARARYIDGMADFGQDFRTRAVRLRVIKQWSEKSGYPAGVRLDRGGIKIDPKRCRVYGVIPLHYLGGEAPTDPLFTQRLEIHDADTGSWRANFPSQATAISRSGRRTTAFMRSRARRWFGSTNR